MFVSTPFGRADRRFLPHFVATNLLLGPSREGAAGKSRMIPDFNLLSARLSLIQLIRNPSHNTIVAGTFFFAYRPGQKLYSPAPRQPWPNHGRPPIDRLMVRGGFFARFFRNGKARSPDWAALLGLNRRAAPSRRASVGNWLSGLLSTPAESPLPRSFTTVLLVSDLYCPIQMFPPFLERFNVGRQTQKLSVFVE
ncbi:hypothetical protein LCGC14_2661670 [marine sediment metagenome]|uniref:Uncharacterized protein n=1 Tax=marine sediment metagenome TaxID=412755 RepID=A0A0F8ZRS0_9ZZZZ